MRHQIKVPRLGDTTRSVLIAEWLCTVGAEVAVGTPLVAVETDKITTELPSPVVGRLVEQLAAVNDELPVGAPFCVIQE